MSSCPCLPVSGECVGRRGDTSSVRAHRRNGHDRGTASPCRDTRVAAMNPTDAPALLQSALEQLRLEGAIFFRSELTEGFAFESTPQLLADALHPGADRIILFHIV